MPDPQPFANCAIPQPWTGTPEKPPEAPSRPVLITPDFLEHIASELACRVEWGEPGGDGFYTPTFMRITNPETWDEGLSCILAELRRIMLDRQAKHGQKGIARQGLYGVLTRGAADKGERVMHALHGRIVGGAAELDAIDNADGTFEDSLLDWANYVGPIALMLYRGWWNLPRKDGG